MAKFKLNWIANQVDGEVLCQVSKEFSGISTDTRKPMQGQIFIPLRGANFDAHNFLDKAVEQGAELLIVDSIPEKFSSLKGKVSIIQVKDTLEALQKFAKAWRKQVKCKVVGITGSNGKTTTKEFAATILSRKFKTYASPGSFNNHWGVPLSLLSMDDDTEWAVIEMGMNSLGEIKHLCEIAMPDITLVTMVGSAHIGELGSREAIAKAKAEIYENCPKAIQIYNKDNEHTINMYNSALLNLPKETVANFKTFSAFDKSSDASLRAEVMKLGSTVMSGQIGHVEGKVEVNVFGRHNVNNFMAAACIALAAGMKPDEIWQALPDCKGIWGRNQIYQLNKGATVLFDGYNASFESVSALVKNLFEFDLQGKKIAVIGQMLELGKDSEDLHEKVGELVAQTGFSAVWFIGPDKHSFERGMKRGGFEKNLMLSDSYEESLAIKIGSMLDDQDVAIIKGSRDMKLEQVLDTWKEQSF